MFREMRRKAQQLSEDECISILTKAPRGVLAVLGDSGYPYAIPLNFLYKDGALYFHGAKTGHKVDALMKCNKVSFCVIDEGKKTEGAWYFTFKSVIAFGTVSFLTNEAEALEHVRELGLKYNPYAEDVEDELNNAKNRVLCFKMNIDHLSGKIVKEK